MTVIGEAYINVIAKTEGFEKSLHDGSASGLRGLEKDVEGAGVTAGGGLGRGIEGGTKDGLGKAEAAAERSGKSMGGKLTGGLSAALGGLGSMFGLDFLEPMSHGVDKAGEHMDHAGGKAKSLGSTLSSVGGGIALGAVAGIAAFSAEGIKLGMNMEATDSKIAAAGDVSQEAAKKIGDAFLGTAGKTTFSGQQMATAYASVAGQLTATEGHALSSSEALAVMTASTDAAEASGQSLDSVTGALSKTMQDFHLKAGDAASASDYLYNASKSTGTGIDTLAQMMGKLHSSLGANAPGLASMSSLLVEFAHNGVSGKGAIAAMSSSLNALTNPTQKQADALKFLGVNLTDANGKFIGMGPAMDALKGHLGENGNALEKQAAQVLFSGKTYGQIKPLIEGGSKAWYENASSVSKSGSAHEAAEKASSNLHGQMEKLKSSIQDAATKWGQVLIPIVQKVIAVLVKVGNYVMDHKALLIVVGAVLAGIFIAMLAGWVINTVAAMSFWAAATGGIIILVAAIAVGIAWIVTHWSQVWKFCHKIIEDVWNWIKTHWKLLVEIIAGPIGIAVVFVVNHFKQIKNFVMGVVDWIKTHWQLLLAIITGPIGLAVLFIKDHFDQIVHFASDVIDAVTHFFGSLPGKIAAFFTGIWDKVWADFKQVAVWLYVHVESPAIEFFKAIPGKVAALFAGFFDTAWAALKTVAVWVYTNVEAPFISWVVSLPGKAASAAGNFLDTAFNALTKIGDWLDTHVWQPISRFFSGLPGRIASAAGNLLGGLGSGVAHLLGFAGGGDPPVGVPSLVGEQGPELFVPHQSGTIIPTSRVKDYMGHGSPVGFGGGASVTQNNSFVLSQDVTDDTIRKIERMLEKNNRDLAQRMGALR